MRRTGSWRPGGRGPPACTRQILRPARTRCGTRCCRRCAGPGRPEPVDGLVELLIGLIHRVNARAERRVGKELIGELVNVPGTAAREMGELTHAGNPGSDASSNA
jgi:hypothetical protein